MIVVTAVLGTLGTLVGLVLALVTLREKLRAARPHPLEAAVRDVASAVREHSEYVCVRDREGRLVTLRREDFLTWRS